MSDRPDPSGARGEAPEPQCLDLCPICRAADVIRASSSPELRDQWEAVQREALVTLRALIDHYLERLDESEAGGGAPAGPAVEEIPIE